MRDQAYLRRLNGRKKARAWRSTHSEKYQISEQKGYSSIETIDDDRTHCSKRTSKQDLSY